MNRGRDALRRNLRRHIALTLVLAGYGTALLNYAMALLFEPSIFGPFDWRGWLFGGTVFFVLAVAFFYLGPHVAIYALRAHKSLKLRVFDKAIDADSFYPLETCIVCVALNVALFTIADLLPLRELLVALLPPLQTIAGLLPASYADVAGINILWLFVPAAVGPAIIFGLKWLRRESDERGETFIEILQVLVYLSLILPFIVWSNPGSFSSSSLQQYSNIVGLILLPGSIGGVGFLAFLQERRKSPYIT